MNNLTNLIKNLCPLGVEFLTLGEVCEFRSGWGFPEKEQGLKNEKYPFYKVSDMNNSKIFMDIANNYISEETAKKLKCKPAPKDTIIFPKIGAAMMTNKKRILTKESCYDNNIMGIIAKYVDAKFLFYCFSRYKLYDLAKGTGAVPSLDTDKLKKIKIPIPPIEIQKEIVRILDKFAEIINELIEKLSEELTLRKKQYEFYRDKLLTFGAEVEFKKLGEIAEIGTGNGNTESEIEDGIYPFFVRSPIVRRKNNFDFDETAIITSGDGVGVGKIFHYIEGKYALHQRAYRIHITDKKILPKFIFYYMSAAFYDYLHKVVFNSSVTSIRKQMIEKFSVPIPPIEEQARIVKILDRFDKLCNDLSEGLPAEISLRKKQYEFYRDKLLTFDEKKLDFSAKK